MCVYDPSHEPDPNHPRGAPMIAAALVLWLAAAIIVAPGIGRILRDRP